MSELTSLPERKSDGTPRNPIRELQERRAEIELARAELELTRLKRHSKKLQESNILWDWISGYQDLLDRLGTSDGRLLLTPSTVQDRRYGANWPHWRTWQEHALLRAQARFIADVSDIACGILGGLTAYVVGPGYKHRVVPRKRQNPPAELVDACQEYIKCWSKLNGLPQREQQFFRRCHRDGEGFQRDFEQEEPDTGAPYLALRWVEPEMVMDAQGLYLLADQDVPLSLGQGSFGVITEPGDVEHVLGFNVCYDGYPSEGEFVSVGEMCHVKVNVDGTIKRGMPDFIYDTYDGIKSAGRCVSNMVDSAAIQAAIAEIRQHETARPDQVQAFVDSEADFQTPLPTPSGKTINNRATVPGTVRDIPKGLTYVAPPFSQGGETWIAIVQKSLQRVGVRWNAPDWLTSGDASSNSYANALEAKAPFTRRVQAWQEFYAGPFQGNVIRALKHACRAGRIRAKGRTWTWEEVWALVDVQSEPPSLVERDASAEAQANSTYIQNKVKSVQTVQQELGLDTEQEATNIEEWDERFGQQGGGLPMPGNGDDQGGGGGDLSSLLGESMIESADGSYWLLEYRPGLVQKTITDKAGRQRKVWVRSEPKPKGKPRPGKSPDVTPDHIKAALDSLAGQKPAPEEIQALAKKMVDHLTVEQLKGINREMQLKAGTGKKADMAQRMAERAIARVKGGTTPPAAKPAPAKKPKAQEPAKPPVPAPNPAKAEPFEFPDGFEPEPEESSDAGKNVPNPSLPQGAAPNLSLPEAKAIELYTTSAFLQFNKRLREGTALSPEQQQMHEQLQSAMAKTTPFEKPVQTFRGLMMGSDADLQAFEQKLLEAQQNGGVLRMPGYSSCSTSDKSSFEFQGNVRLEITARKGLDARPYSRMPDEDELLLPHDSRFRVTSVETSPSPDFPEGIMVVKLEQLLDEPSKVKESRQPVREDEGQDDAEQQVDVRDNPRLNTRLEPGEWQSHFVFEEAGNV